MELIIFWLLRIHWEVKSQNVEKYRNFTETFETKVSTSPIPFSIANCCLPCWLMEFYFIAFLRAKNSLLFEFVQNLCPLARAHANPSNYLFTIMICYVYLPWSFVLLQFIEFTHNNTMFLFLFPFSTFEISEIASDSIKWNEKKAPETGASRCIIKCQKSSQWLMTNWVHC